MLSLYEQIAWNFTDPAIWEIPVADWFHVPVVLVHALNGSMPRRPGPVIAANGGMSVKVNFFLYAIGRPHPIFLSCMIALTYLFLSWYFAMLLFVIQLATVLSFSIALFSVHRQVSGYLQHPIPEKL